MYTELLSKPTYSVCGTIHGNVEPGECSSCVYLLRVWLLSSLVLEAVDMQAVYRKTANATIAYNHCFSIVYMLVCRRGVDALSSLLKKISQYLCFIAYTDRLVILGNHRDSWNFGAADATSGSAALMEIARGLGKLRKMGWRPRRTMMLCSWDAEEYGLMGSMEWVEVGLKYFKLC